MSNIAIFKTGKTPEYRESVNTPDYDQDVDVIVNPDISLVINVPKKYWKRSGNSVLEMNNTEKKAVDDKEKLEKETSIDNLNIESKDLADALIGLGIVTKQDLTNYIKTK